MWNRTARLNLIANAIPVAYPSAHAYRDNEIDALDLQIASRNTLPKLAKKKDRWIPEWTIPFSGAARYEERTGLDDAPRDTEPPNFLKEMGSGPGESEDDEDFDVD